MVSRLPNIGATVVVPTLNRGTVAADCVRDLLAQTHRPLEILVVDQSERASDELKVLAESQPDLVHWHRLTFRGLPAARNYGWQHAAHEVIVFVDDDIRCGPGLVTEHIRALCLPNVGVVAGAVDETEAQKPSEPTGIFRRWTATPLRGFEADWEGEVDHAPGGNFSTWRHLIARLGGIDERFQVGAALYEETDYCLRVRGAGLRIYFNGRARLTHLGFRSGGCRVPDISQYALGLAQNRTILIQRYLKWYHLPSAFLELSRLSMAYVVHYRRLDVFTSFVVGCLKGLRAGKRAPICTCRGGSTDV